jgi:hypothetical protein
MSQNESRIQRIIAGTVVIGAVLIAALLTFAT